MKLKSILWQISLFMQTLQAATRASRATIKSVLLSSVIAMLPPSAKAGEDPLAIMISTNISNTLPLSQHLGLNIPYNNTLAECVAVGGGVQSGASFCKSTQLAANVVKSVGFGTIRVPIYWNDLISNNNGSVAFNCYWIRDLINSNVNNANLILNPQGSTTLDLYGGSNAKPVWPVTAINAHYFGQFVAAMTKCDYPTNTGMTTRGLTWELWNEPANYGPGGQMTMAQYATLFNYATPVIRAADPTAKVITAALSGTPDGNMMSSFVASGISAYPDGVGMHVYLQPPAAAAGTTATADPEVLFNRNTGTVTNWRYPAMKAAAVAGKLTKPVYVTEGGYNLTDSGICSRTPCSANLTSSSPAWMAYLWRANMDLRWILTNWIGGFSNLSIFDFDDSMSTGGYGIVQNGDNDYATLQVINVLSAMAANRTLTGYTIDSTEPQPISPPVVNAMRLVGASDHVYIFWLRSGAGTANIYQVPLTAKAMDMYGNPKAIVNQTVSVSSQWGPIYVQY